MLDTKIPNAHNLKDGKFILAYGFQKIQSMVSWPQDRNDMVEGTAEEICSHHGIQEAERARRSWDQEHTLPGCTPNDPLSHLQWGTTSQQNMLLLNLLVDESTDE